MLGTMLLVGLIGGIGAAATYSAYHYAEKTGPSLSKSLKSDLSPMSPEKGPPLPSALGIKWPGKKR